MKKKILSAIVFCTIALLASAQNNKERNFHLSLISPLGTNGIQSHLFTNKVSVNMLGGYSYSNTVVEFGGLYNVNTHLTKGAQFAGIANYSGEADRAAQFAGILNMATDGMATTQVGGIVNIAEDVSVQISGIVNVAKRVKGVQIGLINIAEECSEGVSLGLISIVKHGGKHEFELSFSDAIHTAVNFKLGTDRLYTIFSGGVSYINTPVEYAAGLGLGTHLDWRKGWGNQIELMGYSITENGEFPSGFNMLSQLKFIVSKQLAPHFSVFGGPVLNMTISDLVNPETGEIGSSLAPYAVWEQICGKTILKAWVGFTAGVRF